MWEVAGLGRLPNSKGQIEQFLNKREVGKGLGKEGKGGEIGQRREAAIQVFCFYFHI